MDEENEDSPINIIHTPCKKCLFATHEDKTQTGCYMGLIDEYRQNDHIEILDVYDEDKEFYVINNKRCAGYKEQKYFDNRNMENSTLEEKANYVREKILSINYVAVIDMSAVSFNKLSDVLKELENSIIQPRHVIFVKKSKCAGYGPVKKIFEESSLKCGWVLKSLLDDKEPFEFTLHGISMLAPKQYNFVLAIGKEYKAIPTIVETAQNRVYKEFGKFGIISSSPNTLDTFIFNSTVYRVASFDGLSIFDLTENHEFI